jgi:hypothetical protein
MLSTILFSRLNPYIDELVGDEYGFQCNRSSTDQMLCIYQVQEKKCECGETVYQLFIDFQKTYDSIRKDVLYNILTEFGVPTKIVRLIKMCLYETYTKVHIGRQLSDEFAIQNDPKQGDALSR